MPDQPGPQAGATYFYKTLALPLPQTATKTIFSFQGGGGYGPQYSPGQILSIFGIVTVAIGAVANATKLQALMDALTAVDLCATVDMNAAAVGTLFSITGTFANAATLNANGVSIGQAGPIQVSGGGTTGYININCAGSDGGVGRVVWYMLARVPYGVRVVPAQS